MTDRSIREAEAAKLRELYEARKSAARLKDETFNQSMIAKIGGWTQPNVSSYLKGIVEIKEESALVFAEALNVPVSAFSPRIADKISRREMLARNPLLGKREISYVPKLTRTALDKIKHRLNEQSFIMPLSEETTPISKSVSSNSFAYDLDDQSLQPKYPQGTTFVFDPALSPVPTRPVLVSNKNKDNDFHIREYCVTEVLEDGTEVYELRPLNPAFPTLKDNYEVLGVAVAVLNYL